MKETSKPLIFIPNKDFYPRIISVFDMMGAGDMIEIENDLKKCILKNKPFFIPVVLHLEHPNLITDNQLLKSLHKIKNSYLILDYSEESIPIEGKISEKLIELHNLLETNNFDPSRVIVMTANENVDEYYKLWTLKNNIKYKLNILGFNPLFFRNTSWLLNNSWFLNLLKKIPQYSSENPIRNKKFMCLNLRPRIHRSAIVSYLILKSYIKEGIVTYFGQKFGNKDSISVDEDNVIQQFISKLLPNNKLLDSYHKLQSISPLEFDRNEENMRKSAYNNENLQKWKHLIPELVDEESINIMSYFEIVTETWFETKENLFLSEKTMRAIIRMQFFIIVGSPYTLRYLRELGFKTFSPYIDESYDEVDDPVERMQKILVEIDKLCNLTHTQLRKLYTELYPVIEHNYNILTTKMPNIFKSHIRDKFLLHLPQITKNTHLDFIDKIKNYFISKNIKYEKEQIHQ